MRAVWAGLALLGLAAGVDVERHPRKRWSREGADRVVHIKEQPLFYKMDDVAAQGELVNGQVQQRLAARIVNDLPAFDAEGGPLTSAGSFLPGETVVLGDGNSAPVHGQLKPTMHKMDLPDTHSTQWMSSDVVGQKVGKISSGVMSLLDGQASLRVLKEGTGSLPSFGESVTVHYVGRRADGSVFESTREAHLPRMFDLGTGAVVPCLDEAVGNMRMGERVMLQCKAESAYGSKGSPSLQVDPDAEVSFDLELVPEGTDGSDAKGDRR